MIFFPSTQSVGKRRKKISSALFYRERRSDILFLRTCLSLSTGLVNRVFTVSIELQRTIKLFLYILHGRALQGKRMQNSWRKKQEEKGLESGC